MSYTYTFTLWVEYNQPQLLLRVITIICLWGSTYFVDEKRNPGAG